jgi:hypothetical protein
MQAQAAAGSIGSRASQFRHPVEIVSDYSTLRATRYLPQVAVATTVVAVLPVAVAWWLRASGRVSSPWVCVGVAMVLSLAASLLGSAYWKRRRPRDLFFSELLLWGWLRRLRAERQLSNAVELLGLARVGGWLGNDRDAQQKSRLLGHLAASLDAQDPYTDGHSRRVARHSPSRRPGARSPPAADQPRPAAPTPRARQAAPRVPVTAQEPHRGAVRGNRVPAPVVRRGPALEGGPRPAWEASRARARAGAQAPAPAQSQAQPRAGIPVQARAGRRTAAAPAARAAGQADPDQVCPRRTNAKTAATSNSASRIRASASRLWNGALTRWVRGCSRSPRAG